MLDQDMAASSTKPCPYCTVRIPAGRKTCPSCAHRLPQATSLKALRRQNDRYFRFLAVSELYITTLVVAGCAGQIGALYWALKTQDHSQEVPWFLLGGTVSLCLGLALYARVRYRSWKWGLVGVFGLPAAGLLYVLLRKRCLGCGELQSMRDECPTCARR